MSLRSRRDGAVVREDDLVSFNSDDLVFEGRIPGISPTAFNMFRIRLFELITDLVCAKGAGPFQITAGYGEVERQSAGRTAAADHPTSEPSHQSIDAMWPIWRFDQLVLPSATLERLLDCVAFVEVAPIVFDKWNLRSIEPNPSLAINFRGPPGTGKTMAAHALAHQLGRRILTSRLSDLESKYHGDGPKNVVRLFESASVHNTVLFIDEAESLLSRRFAQPDQAAESAINSMRTELLMALDSFDGLAIFASNLYGSYDKAISSRLTHVDFELPDFQARLDLWRNHLPPELPLAKGVDFDVLASVEGITGRDIKQTVLSAAVGAARRQLPALTMELLLDHLRQQQKGGSESESTASAESAQMVDEATRAKIRDRVANLPEDEDHVQL